jgi:hypothetical protein
MTHWEIRVLPTALVLLFISLLLYGTFRRQQIIPYPYVLTEYSFLRYPPLAFATELGKFRVLLFS